MPPPDLDRLDMIASIISQQITSIPQADGSVIRGDHFRKHGNEFGAKTRAEYEDTIKAALQDPKTIGVYGKARPGQPGENGQWIFKASVPGPDGKPIPMVIILNKEKDGTFHGTAFDPSKARAGNSKDPYSDRDRWFKSKCDELPGNPRPKPIPGGLEGLESKGGAKITAGFLAASHPRIAEDLTGKAKKAARLGTDIFAGHSSQAAELGEIVSHLPLGKIAGVAGKVIKIAGPALVAIAITEQAQAADRIVVDGKLSPEAAFAYKALITTALTGGIVDPTFGVASDAALNEAFKKFADTYHLDQKTREELNPSLSAIFNNVVLTPEQQRFMNHYESLPATTDPSNPPEINRLIELKQQIEQGIAETSKPDGKLHGPEEAEALQAQHARIDKLKAQYADLYTEAAEKNPQFLSSLDKSADVNVKAVELAKDRKVQAEANALIDSLPEKTSPDLSPQTNRLIEARNALRARVAELEQAEKTDLAAGKPVLGYYGKKIDEAVQNFVEAYAREKINGTAPDPAQPKANEAAPDTIDTPMARLLPQRGNAIELKKLALEKAPDSATDKSDVTKLPERPRIAAVSALATHHA